MNKLAHYFDEYIDRHHTESAKWEEFAGRFPGMNSADCVPMWVADMDFKCPPEVIEAVCKRAAAGIYGYNMFTPDSYINAVVLWMKKRHNWDIQKDWIVFTPGIVPALNHAVMALTTPGDGVIIQMPVYYPFHAAIQKNGRELVNNQLLLENDRYEMDFEDLERKASDPKNKVMILCSPHNPVGRVWSGEEIRRVNDICKRNGVVLISDEIHSDLLLKGAQFVATGADPRYTDNVIACYAPSKTFNMAGIQASAIIIANPVLRQALKDEIAKTRLPGMNVFAGVALEAAYTYGDSYIDAVMDYIEANIDHAVEFTKRYTPKIKIMKPQGTYLVWISLHELGLPVEQAERFFIERAKIAADLGTWFGPGGEGFVRMNFACHRSTLDKALAQLKEAYEKEFA